MSATLSATATAVTTIPARRPAFGRILWQETRCELLKLLRARTFTLSGLGFPLMFYLLFGVSNRAGHIDGAPAAKYMLAGYACFGLVGAALFSIGVGLSGERTAGWLELKRASPMPPAAMLLAKVATAAAFGLLVILALCGVALTLGGVHLSGRELGLMLLTGALGTIPFASLGLLIALLAPPNAAAPVVNLLYLPMSFASGLWIPLTALPHWLQKLAPTLPTYHLSQAMLTVFGYQIGGPLRSHVLGLAAFTAIMLGLAAVVFHHGEENA